MLEQTSTSHQSDKILLSISIKSSVILVSFSLQLIG